jgi:hypothetical protein
MVRHSLARALCLSVALLTLGSGLALAQAWVSIEPSCVECCPLEGLGPCPGYTALVTSEGWEPNQRLTLVLRGPGPAGPFGTGLFSADERGHLEVQLIFLCENPWLAEEATAQFVEKYWWIHPQWKPADFGEWTLEVGDQQGSAAANVLFAEDCVAAQFVPEPASLVLLGGGLLTMAGYVLARRGAAL